MQLLPVARSLFRENERWYAVAIFIIGAVYLLSLALYCLFGGALPTPLIRLSFNGFLWAILGQIYPGDSLFFRNKKQHLQQGIDHRVHDEL